jgi:hypothetical protein
VRQSKQNPWQRFATFARGFCLSRPSKQWLNYV